MPIYLIAAWLVGCVDQLDLSLHWRYLRLHPAFMKCSSGIMQCHSNRGAQMIRLGWPLSCPQCDIRSLIAAPTGTSSIDPEIGRSRKGIFNPIML
ncbi:hypothetical protein CBS147317_1884 [Penicillium roqueforti]|uniref:uncharacterized protein n=1 Tax=Penicillium roqueforti TaxID=5082 RepID=UPI001909E0C3|nr:uncharacterized protein LCP9604111_7697 [Penicillium roqueforti]KAF9243314.1 hypothetical protein LCP9604111_7697 [Penicillium roqueforti]KAI1833854.1 hypothetical protein CBS147337_5409 [Penicillium roqueforti]KAI2704932.1 hypothetical protein CBS147372_1235 [Penicillium roqueforti]KAI3130970.1 hypothetical protein CBS147330_4671 [Penicillium roqueforti]KAI3144268.1 hypothetical protein CBS147326_1272 [Penicillium roqueforti]